MDVEYLLERSRLCQGFHAWYETIRRCIVVNNVEEVVLRERVYKRFYCQICNFEVVTSHGTAEVEDDDNIFGGVDGLAVPVTSSNVVYVEVTVI